MILTGGNCCRKHNLMTPQIIGICERLVENKAGFGGVAEKELIDFDLVNHTQHSSDTIHKLMNTRAQKRNVLTTQIY